MAVVKFDRLAFGRSLRRQVRANMNRATEYAVREVKQTLLGAPVPSRPGEPPRVVTGRHRRSIRRKPAKIIRGDVVGFYGSRGVKYARRLEYGFVGTTSDGRAVRQEPRPYLRPILRSKKRQIARIIATGK